MKPPKIIKTDSPEWPIFEPFPEPRTMPEGWDLSGFDSEHNWTKVPANIKLESSPNIEL